MSINEAATVVDRYPHHPDVSHYSQHSRTTSTSSSHSLSRSRASSVTAQPAPPTSLPRQQEPHIRFRGAPDPQKRNREALSSSESSPRQQHHAFRTSEDQPPPPSSPRLQPTHPSTMSLNNSVANSPSRIKVRDLTHIQSFASEDFLSRSRQPSRHSLQGRLEGAQQYEISSMPVTDIIEMVAGLLTKITTQNDRQPESRHRRIPSTSEGASGLSREATSILAFHGKNIPTITINSYLMRIHKYCPTTYEVFLSLLIYFDRMTEMINQGKLSTFQKDEPAKRQVNPRSTSQDSTVTVRPDSPGRMSMSPPPDASSESEEMMESQPSEALESSMQRFVVDSFNIHRLVMAGVTCASKFFSDVFYTNSRYAKVGGLPLVELNHLELQFLLLNDFRLSISLEDLESYGTRLVDFYMEEIVAQQQQQQKGLSSPTSATADDGIYMKV